MRTRTLALLGMALLLSPVLARAQDGYEQGRVRLIEGNVVLQRGSETSAEEAAVNMPFLPGDRVWTDGGGRGEFQFAAARVRLDIRSKLDYVTFDEGRDGRIVLRLWSGSVFVHTHDLRGGPDLEVETPGGVVRVLRRAVSRVDVRSGETRLSVYEGEAVLEAGRETRVREGERVYVAQGEEVEGPETFDRGEAEADDFARWDSDLEQQAWADSRSGYVPDELAPYGAELDAHGAWYYEAEVGHVWRPYVSVGWSPYSHGRWCWTAYGWTWVPNEPWGWAPFHYGRWGHSVALGWYWIPGRTWGPAWVSWAVGGDYVGWCPLGYRDRPVLFHDSRRRGFAVPRGTAPGSVASAPWVYARRADLSSRDLSRRRLDRPVDVSAVRVLEPGRARLTRDLRVAEGERAVPRHVRTNPTIGDSVPELRHDSTTTIPFPAVRRAREREERGDGQGGGEGMIAPRNRAGRTVAPRPGSVNAPAEVRGPAQGSGSSAVRNGDSGRPAERGEAADRAVPRNRPARERWEGSAPAEGSRPGEVRGPSDDRARRREEQRDPDREVLRPLFRPLAQPQAQPQERGEPDRGESARRRRYEGDGDRPRPRPESVAPPPREREPRSESGGRGERRAEPRHQAPPRQHPSNNEGRGAARRKKGDS